MAGDDPDRLLIVEINPDLPGPVRCRRSSPTPSILDRIDVLVETDSEPFALADALPDDIDRAIAAEACELVTDGATLQIGIGAIPNIVATAWPRAPAATTASTARCSPTA